MRIIAQRGLTQGSGGLAAGSSRPMLGHPYRGKRSIGLALEKPEELEVLYGLDRQADVFLVNFLPAARGRLKLKVEDLRYIDSDGNILEPSRASQSAIALQRIGQRCAHDQVA